MSGEFIGIVAATVVVLATGVVLTRKHRPYGGVLLTVHKLVGVAAVAVVVVGAFGAARASTFATPQIALFASTALFALATIASGAIASASQTPSWWVVWIHRMGSWLMCALFLGSAYVVFG